MGWLGDGREDAGLVKGCEVVGGWWWAGERAHALKDPLSNFIPVQQLLIWTLHLHRMSQIKHEGCC